MNLAGQFGCHKDAHAWLFVLRICIPVQMLVDNLGTLTVQAFMLGGAVAAVFILLFGFMGIFGSMEAILNPDK